MKYPGLNNLSSSQNKKLRDKKGKLSALIKQSSNMRKKLLITLKERLQGLSVSYFRTVKILKRTSKPDSLLSSHKLSKNIKTYKLFSMNHICFKRILIAESYN